jgi:hypothetical protein
MFAMKGKSEAAILHPVPIMAAEEVQTSLYVQQYLRLSNLKQFAEKY